MATDLANWKTADKSVFMVFKMTTQVTQTECKENNLKKSWQVQYIDQKPSDFGHLNRTAKISRFFLNILVPLRYFQFLTFVLSLCDMCGNFEYQRPYVSWNEIFDPRRRTGNFHGGNQGGCQTFFSNKSNRNMVNIYKITILNT